MQQNAARDHWSFEQTESRLAAVMRDVHTSVAGFLRVAKAMMEQGVI
ncbi:hypothetical protein ACFZAV_30785 [Streptomyces sp. NPDC008343]